MPVACFTAVSASDSLPIVYRMLCQQTMQDWQWHISATSQDVDKWILSTGDIRVRKYDETHIKQCSDVFYLDPNSYYAPEYLQQRLTHCYHDSSSLSAWFGFDYSQNIGLYFSHKEPHWERGTALNRILQTASEIYLKQAVLVQEHHNVCSRIFGYVCKAKYFDPEPKLLQDHVYIADERGLAVEAIHDKITLDKSYYHLPLFLVKKHLPVFWNHLQQKENCLC